MSRSLSRVKSPYNPMAYSTENFETFRNEKDRVFEQHEAILRKNLTLSQELGAGSLKKLSSPTPAPAVPHELPDEVNANNGFSARNVDYGTLVIDPTATGILPSPGTDGSQ